MVDNSLIRYIVGASRVKYEVLDEILLKHPDLDAVSTAKHYDMVVMFVDGYSLLYRLYLEKNLTALYADNRAELVRDLVVGFMNVLGHYRRYMSTRLHLMNDIICTFNMTRSDFQNTMVPGFDDRHYLKMDPQNPIFAFINNALREAWDYIVGISMYFEGIYCVSAQGVDDVTTWMMLSNISDDHLYLILSRNQLAMQLLANQSGCKPTWFQIFPKRGKSYCVGKSDCISRGHLVDRKLIPHERLGPADLPYLWAFGGCGYVRLPTTAYVSGISGAVRVANKFIETTGHIPSEYSFPRFCEAVQTFVKNGDTITANISNLRKRFAAVSVNLTLDALPSSKVHQAKRHMIDLFDQSGLEELNDSLIASCAGETEPIIMELDNLNMGQAN